MPEKFNLDEYEPVKSRKQRFRTDNPTGVIIPAIVSDLGEATKAVVIRASIWRARDSYVAGEPPDSVGYSLSLAGGIGADATSWVENCEESAIGRALDNLGYIGSLRASREEMAQADRHADLLADHSATKRAIPKPQHAPVTHAPDEESAPHTDLMPPDPDRVVASGPKGQITASQAVAAAAGIELDFGKYAGRTLGDLWMEDRPYLGWLSEKARDPNIASAAKALLHAMSSEKPKKQTQEVLA